MISSILILALAFLSLIALMIIHEFGHFIIAKKFGVRVDEFGIGYPPRIFGKKIGETIYSINWIPLGAFVRIYGEEGGVDDYRSFTKLKIWQRVLIIIGGVVAFWIAAMILFSVVFAIGANLPVADSQSTQGFTNIHVEVFSVVPNSPASTAGLKVGDTLLEVRSAKYESANYGPEVLKIDKTKDFQEFTKKHAGEELTLDVQRAGHTVSLKLTPRVNPPDGQGPVGIGLERMGTFMKKYAFYEAPFRGIAYTWETTWNSLKGLWKVIADLFNHKPLPEGAATFAGPLGISVFLANAFSYGIGFFIYFIGVISVLVAIFNLLPIPALDGGKLVFLLIEKIKGKPVSVKVEQAITVVFFAILICLSLYITVRYDFPRISDYFKSSLQR